MPRLPALGGRGVFGWGTGKTFAVPPLQPSSGFVQNATNLMETEAQKRLSARITGRVQGVGFRNFTQRRARRLDVTGWVRNERDGSVRLEAEGLQDALNSLLDSVHQGPRMARVENVEVDWADATGDFTTFRVRR